MGGIQHSAQPRQRGEMDEGADHPAPEPGQKGAGFNPYAALH